MKMKDVPSDIIHEILYRLPVKYILRCRSVSKLYRRIIDDPEFIKTHQARGTPTLSLGYRHSLIFQLEENDTDGDVRRSTTMAAFPLIKDLFRVLGAAQGCLLLMLGDRKVCLWNPSRRESIELASVSRVLKETWFFGLGLGLGLGFDIAMTEYKIVYIYQQFSQDKTVLIYSSKTKSWRKSTNSLPPLYGNETAYDFPRLLERVSDNHRNATNGLFLNGSIHWLYFPSRRSVGLVSFDMKTEEVSFVTLDFLKSVRGEPKLAELGGYLAIGLWFLIRGYGYKRLEKVWVLMDGKWKIIDIENKDEYQAYYYVNNEGSKCRIDDVFRCKQTLLSLKDF